MEISINRSGIEITTIPIDERATFTHVLMGDHTLAFSFDAPQPIHVQIGDTLTYKGEVMTLNTVPEIVKKSSRLFSHSITFQGWVHSLSNQIMMHLENPKFTYYGTAAGYLALIVDLMNQIDTGWSAGFVEETTEKHISFEDQTCLDGLKKICKKEEGFDLEFYLTGKTINLVKQAGNETTLQFEYGRGNGLYSLTRQYVSDKNVVTKVFGYGSEKNLPADYRDGIGNLAFDPGYLTKNTDKYGVKVGIYRNEDIYPHRDGTITAASAITEDTVRFTITDDSIDFDINDYLLAGSEATISFKTGELTGYEFVISNYNHSTKTLTCELLTESSGYVLPNTTFAPAVGDKYTLINISMPTEYVTAAETQLQEETQAYLDENSIPRVLYSLELDPIFMRDNNISLHPGDKVTVIDDSLGINTQLRVNGISYSANFPDLLTPGTKIEANISDFIVYNITQKAYANTLDTKKTVKLVDRTNAERARRNTFRMNQLRDLIYDPDGYFDPENIRPNSIETLMLSVGAKSQNFALNGVVIRDNDGGDPNALTITGGQLIHRAMSIDGLGYIWTVEPNAWTDLDPAKSYYIYARCSRTALTGQWQISETPVLVDQEVGYWNFVVGVLYAVTDGYRDHDFTNGQTVIVGDNITTGRIQDISQANFFDLVTGSFKLGDETYGIDWNVTTEGRLTIRGFVIANDVEVGSGGVINAGISGLTPDGLDSIMLWAGGDKVTATFKVNQRGEIFSTAGFIGGFNIGPNSMTGIQKYDDDENPIGGKFVLYPDGTSGFMAFFDSDGSRWAGIGANVFPSSSGVAAVARFENTESNALGTNYAAYVRASGAGNNIALSVGAGDINLSNSSKISRFTQKIVRVSGNFTVTDENVVIQYDNGTVYLPSNPNEGRTVNITKISPSKTLYVNGNGNDLRTRGDTNSGSITVPWGWTFIWDGQFWVLIEAQGE